MQGRRTRADAFGGTRTNLPDEVDHDSSVAVFQLTAALPFSVDFIFTGSWVPPKASPCHCRLFHFLLESCLWSLLRTRNMFLMNIAVVKNCMLHSLWSTASPLQIAESATDKTLSLAAIQPSKLEFGAHQKSIERRSSKFDASHHRISF